MLPNVSIGSWAVALSFTALFILNGALWLAKRHKAMDFGSRRAQLSAEIVYLRRESIKLNTPSTYAKCAKYQRLANAKEKELAELNAGPAVPGVAQRLVLICGAVKVLVLGAFTLALWDTPVAQVVPRSVVAPLGWLLAFPKGADLAAFGGVAVAPWLLLADVATGAMARAAFPPPPPPTTGGVDVERLARELETTGRSRSRAAAAAAAMAGSGTASS